MPCTLEDAFITCSLTGDIIYMLIPYKFITMYTDDTSLHKTFQTSHALKQEMIPAFSRVCKWLKNNKLNIVKTEVMITGTLPKLSQLDYSPGSTLCAIVVEGQAVKRVKLNIK